VVLSRSARDVQGPAIPSRFLLRVKALLGRKAAGESTDGETLALARSLGAAHAINARDPVDEIVELTGGGAHDQLDALGSAATCANSIACLRKRGRHVQVGLLPDPPRVPMDLVIGRELELLGAVVAAAHAYPKMLALVAAGRLRPDRLVTARIGLDAAPEALMAMSDGSPVGITVIRP